jgi:hypothetical protein
MKAIISRQTRHGAPKAAVDHSINLRCIEPKEMKPAASRYSGTGLLVGQLRDLLALDLDARHESLLTPDEDHERLLQAGGRDLPGRAEIRHREVQARADLEALGVLERLQRLGRGEEVGQRKCLRADLQSEGAAGNALELRNVSSTDICAEIAP